MKLVLICHIISPEKVARYKLQIKIKTMFENIRAMCQTADALFIARIKTFVNVFV